MLSEIGFSAVRGDQCVPTREPVLEAQTPRNPDEERFAKAVCGRSRVLKGRGQELGRIQAASLFRPGAGFSDALADAAVEETE